MTNIERHAWLLLPAGVFALEEMTEEALLQLLAVVTVEMREVGVAVHLQPFLFGAGAEPAFKIAARVQTHAAPIRRRQQRRLDRLEPRRARGVVVVEQASLPCLAGNVSPAFRKLHLRQRVRPGNQLARHCTPGAALSDAMLHARHLPRVPAR